MKTIGMLGGMSWESSVVYERIINEEVRRRLGGSRSASLIIRSYDFGEIQSYQERGAWAEAGELLASDARRLVDAGADVIILCTNTMHQVAGSIERAVGSAFIHIADATAAAIQSANIRRVGLLGTRYTMERDFYKERLSLAHGLDVVIPREDDRATVHRVIFDELVRGVIDTDSREEFRAIAGRLVAEGASGIIAGCTEIELLLRPEDVPVAYFPTTRLHALAAVDAALD